MQHMDYIYLNEDYYKNPKETFKFVLDLIAAHIGSKKEQSLLDIGCARGEFLYFAENNRPEVKFLYKVENSKALIDYARSQKFLSNINFILDDGERFFLDMKFDFITSIGVVGYFNSLSPTIAAIKRHLNENGVAFIFHLFNPYDIDVIVKHRNNQRSKSFESGWNLHAIPTAKKELAAYGMKLLNVHKFTLPFEDPKKEDPARSWTVATQDGRMFVNGIGQIYNLYCLEISADD